MIARRESDHAARTLLGVELEQAVARAAQFERAAGLEALAFEPPAATVDSRFDQRGLDHRARDPRRRRDDILARDRQSLDQLPAPSRLFVQPTRSPAEPMPRPETQVLNVFT